MLKFTFHLKEVPQPSWKSSLELIVEMLLVSSKLIKVYRLVHQLESQSHLAQLLSSNQLHLLNQVVQLSASKLSVNTTAGMRNLLLVCILHSTTCFL